MHATCTNTGVENAPFQTPKSQPKQGKKNPPAPRSQPASTTKAPVLKPQAKERDLRQEAMEAVNGLHAHGVSYSALATESVFDGFDKDTLRQLFKEAGIPLEEPPPKQASPPQQPQLLQQVPSAQAYPTSIPSGIDPALVSLLSQGGMNLDPQTLDKLAKAMGQNSLAIPSPTQPTQPTKQQSATSNRSMIPGLAPSSQLAQSLAKPSNKAIKAAQVDKPQTAVPAQQPKAIPAKNTASSTGQPNAREAYLAKLAAAKNKKKGAGTPAAPGESAKPIDQQPSQAPTAVAPTVLTKLSTPAKQPVRQSQKSSSLPNAPESTPSRSMVKMDVLQRKLDAERKAKSAQESAKANAQLAQLPPSRSDSISSIEYNQSNSGSAQSAVGMGDAQEEWTQSGSATPNTGAQAVIPSDFPVIPGLFLRGGEATPQQYQPAIPRQPQIQSSLYSLPSRPEPSNPYQNQTAHVLPPRPPPVASVPSPKPPVLAPRPQAWQPEVSRKRPASTLSGPPSFAPAKRQHEYTWNNRYNRPAVEEDESVVIDISSDDDDDGNDMEIDAEFQTTAAAPAIKSLPAQKILANRALPSGLSGPNSALASPAAVSNPDPIGTAHTGNQQRLDELAEMKRKLQEQLKQKQELKKSKLASSGQQTPVLSSTNAPLVSATAPKTIISHAQNGPEPAITDASNNTPKNKPMSASTKLISTPVVSSPQPSGRRSGLEAEISNDELLLQQMQRKMEEMQEKIARNKTELAQELEEIGVDTQGMSMETMQAVKEDIAQATLEDGATGLPEPETDASLVPEPALPVNLDTRMEESESEDEEGEIDETQRGSEDALPQPSQVEVTGSSDSTSTIPAAQETSSLAVVASVIIAGEEPPIEAAVEVVDDKMSESSDSSSEKDDDEDDNEEYEPEAATLVPPTESATLDDDSDDDRMSTSSESSESSDSYNDMVQLPIHEQAIEEESSGDSDSSDEDDIYETTLGTPTQPAVDVAEADKTDAVATEKTPVLGQIPKEAIPDVVDDTSDSSEDGEISENESKPDSALQLQLEAAMNEDDYESEVAPVSIPNPIAVSPPNADVGNATSGPDSIAVQTEDSSTPESKGPEAASIAPSAAAVNEHGFVLPGLGKTVAYIPQPAAVSADPKSALTEDQVMGDGEDDDYEPPIVPAATQDDEVLSDDYADLYEPSPVDPAVATLTEMPATTGATEAGLSSDEDEPMTVDDGTLPSDEPGVSI